jgi:hypothetical protein
MKTLIPSRIHSRAQVTHISTHGLWLLTNRSELFVSFTDFPQVRNVSSIKLKYVLQLHSDSLYWPDLNLEIPLKRVRSFPLISTKPHQLRRSGRRAKPRSVTA